MLNRRHRHLNAAHANGAMALDARFLTGLADNTALSSWTNRTGSNHPAQGTGANQPKWRASVLNGQPAVQFDGAASPNQDYLSLASFAVSQPFSVIALWISSGKASYLFDGDSATSRTITGYTLSSGSSFGYLGMFAGTVLEEVVDTANAWVLVDSYFNGGSSTQRRNGAQTASGNANTNNMASLRIGERYANISNATQINGYIAAFAILRSPSLALRKRVQHAIALSWKRSCA